MKPFKKLRFIKINDTLYQTDGIRIQSVKNNGGQWLYVKQLIMPLRKQIKELKKERNDK